MQPALSPQFHINLEPAHTIPRLYCRTNREVLSLFLMMVFKFGTWTNVAIWSLCIPEQFGCVHSPVTVCTQLNYRLDVYFWFLLFTFAKESTSYRIFSFVYPALCCKFKSKITVNWTTLLPCYISVLDWAGISYTYHVRPTGNLPLANSTNWFVHMTLSHLLLPNALPWI